MSEKSKDNAIMMDTIAKYEPLWGVWTVESLIGQGSFSKVYKIRRKAFGRAHYSAVKIITIPLDESELRLMEREGLDDEAMREFLQASAQSFIDEINLLSEFQDRRYANNNSHIVNIEDYQIIDRSQFADSQSKPAQSAKQDLGSLENTDLEPQKINSWDILVRMELLTSLTNHTAEVFMPQAKVVKLGIHICRALELCSQKSIIHRNIKPDNIFVSPHGDYKLGDFGIARQIERTSSELSKKGANGYMAPEVFKYESYGPSVDMYSLGIVMYSLLNKNRLPFLPEYPEPILPNDRDNALHRRMKGEAIPVLKGVGTALNSVIQQACAYDRKERFSGPSEMREALERITGT